MLLGLPFIANREKPLYILRPNRECKDSKLVLGILGIYSVSETMAVAYCQDVIHGVFQPKPFYCTCQTDPVRWEIY